MPLFTLTDNGDGRRVEITASGVLETAAGHPARRKVITARVYGVSGSQSRFSISLPTAGLQHCWRGTQYNIGPLDTIYIIDDVADENHLTLIHEDYSNVSWDYQPTLPDGTPEN